MSEQEHNHIKACCADLYARPVVSWLLGDTLHPGGPALTEQLGQMLEIRPSDRALDIGCGGGASAMLLARQFGCRVVGVDLAASSVARARAAVCQEKLEELVDFGLGDAETLPFSDASFDTVFSECAISTFPDKLASAREMARVLKRGGRLGFTDVVVRGKIPELLQGWLLHVACIGGACSAKQYHEIFASAGFSHWEERPHPEGLMTLLHQVRARLLVLEMAGGLRRLDLSELDLGAVKKILAEAEEQIHSGMLSYFAFCAVKEA